MMGNQHEVHLPDLGEIDRVTVVSWLANVGDTVNEGDDLVEVETEKTTFVVPAPHDGRLVRVAAEQGDEVFAGGLLGELEPTSA